MTTTHRKTAKMTTELVCPCGKRLKVSVNQNGWMPSLEAVANASSWHLDRFVEIDWAREIPAFCPHCRIA